MKALNLSLGSAAAIIVSLLASTALAAAPAISNISSVPSTTSATISWTTDVPATSQVGYGTSASTSPYDTQSDFNSALVTSHTVTLQGLTSDTLYNFAVISGMGSTSTSTATSTSDNFTFTTLSNAIPTSTPTSTPTTTPTTTPPTTTPDVSDLIDQLQNLLGLFPSLSTQIQNVIDDLLNFGTTTPGGGDGGTGTSTPPTTGTGHIDQDGQTRAAGGHIDFVGHNFGHEETVLIVRDGVPVGSAHADGAGNFSTGAMSVPGTPDTYTYTFTGQTSGIVGTAVITVE
ncbi:fibronectin type III domain-containing protein [Candidatus Parcubacteria bacterium]|nr:fibronectin type III domain-containing protein [Candidatus Parcubacteria bacterium]